MEEDNKQSDIPAVFYSSETGEPFTNCKVCDKYLLDDSTEYFIEKSYRKYKGYKAEDVVFEFAICAKCHEEMSNQLSKESRAAMQKYMTERVDFEERAVKTFLNSATNPDWWKENCAVTGEPITDLEEYQVVGNFMGANNRAGALPMVVGGKAMDEMAELLSNETLDFLDGFTQTYLGPPPEFEDLLKPRRRPVLI